MRRGVFVWWLQQPGKASEKEKLRLNCEEEPAEEQGEEYSRQTEYQYTKTKKDTRMAGG